MVNFQSKPAISEHAQKPLVFDKLKEEQLKLAKKVISSDFFGKIGLIAGVDCAYGKDDIISTVVVCDYKTMEVKEKVFSVSKAGIPYLGGFLAYREGPAISKAYAKLENQPDIMIFDGNGMLHTRRFGIASHMGILLDKPSIGVAKQLMLGEVKGNVVYVDKEARAELVVTREHARPIYVSPGHKISLKTSVEIVQHCLRFPHKLPEPLHLAHKFSNEIRNNIVKSDSKIEVKKII